MRLRKTIILQASSWNIYSRRKGKKNSNEFIYNYVYLHTCTRYRGDIVNFRRKNERNGRATGKYFKLGMSEERGCKGIPFTCRDHEWEGGVRRAEITRSKGRSVALCPLTGEFYSECVNVLSSIRFADNRFTRLFARSLRHRNQWNGCRFIILNLVFSRDVVANTLWLM